MTRTIHVSVSISEQVLPTGIPAGREGKAEETAWIHAQLSLQSAVTLTTQKQQWTTLRALTLQTCTKLTATDAQHSLSNRIQSRAAFQLQQETPGTDTTELHLSSHGLHRRRCPDPTAEPEGRQPSLLLSFTHQLVLKPALNFITSAIHFGNTLVF